MLVLPYASYSFGLIRLVSSYDESEYAPKALRKDKITFISFVLHISIAGTSDS